VFSLCGCRAICREIGVSESEDPAVMAANLSDGAKRTLLVLDSYESFRLLDSWLRQVFLPSLGDSVRTILSSRAPARPAWRIAPEWRNTSSVELNGGEMVICKRCQLG
jgi:hypothetical protein